MRYISVCSGIEAATVAWHHMGWTPAWFSEIEPFPSAVLAHHYPGVRNLGDMTQWERWPDEPVDLLVGGTPCQSFSVAGLRKGLHDPRGGLMLTFLEIAQRYRPRWVVWENVPGVLSSDGGRDFGAFLGALGELGYGWAYRVLDAQWFGVAQRRRRVFVVGCLGDQASAAAVLFESESVQRNPSPSRETRQGVARGVTRCFAGSSESGVAATLETTSHDYSRADGFNMVAQPVAIQDVRAVEKSQNGRGWNDDGTAYTVDTHATQGVAVAQPIAIQGTLIGRGVNAGPQGSGLDNRGSMFTLTKTDVHAVAQPVATFAKTHKPMSATDAEGWSAVDAAPTVTHWPRDRSDAGTDVAVVQPAMQVRRLTPVECERLQGFPDGYTNIPWRKKDEAPDGPRYKALGNSMAVPCMKWIGERINAIEEKHT